MCLCAIVCRHGDRERRPTPTNPACQLTPFKWHDARAWLHCRLLVGESFVDVDSSAASEFVAAEKDKHNATVKKLKEEIAKIEARQTELRSVLYGRFGRNINLEDGE